MPEGAVVVHPAEVRRREARAEQAAMMRRATARLRQLDQDTAALHGGNPELAEAIAALIENVADGAREPVNAEDWAHAVRFADYVLHPLRADPPGKPLPAGYESPGNPQRVR